MHNVRGCIFSFFFFCLSHKMEMSLFLKSSYRTYTHTHTHTHTHIWWLWCAPIILFFLFNTPMRSDPHIPLRKHLSLSFSLSLSLSLSSSMFSLDLLLVLAIIKLNGRGPSILTRTCKIAHHPGRCCKGSTAQKSERYFFGKFWSWIYLSFS